MISNDLENKNYSSQKVIIDHRYRDSIKYDNKYNIFIDITFI